MYLRKVIYQMPLQIESQISCFHRSQRRNLASMVVGMVYARICRILWTRTAAGLGASESRGQFGCGVATVDFAVVERNLARTSRSGDSGRPGVSFNSSGRVD